MWRLAKRLLSVETKKLGVEMGWDGWEGMQVACGRRKDFNACFSGWLDGWMNERMGNGMNGLRGI